MINGLGVLGWGVGGIEAEAAMLGQPVSMLIPQVVGFKLHGKLREGATATDLVLTVTQMLRKKGVVGKFVEFFGAGLRALPLADRATIANMAPEYGATCGIFPVDDETLRYLRLTGRGRGDRSQLVEAYAQGAGAVPRRERRPRPTTPTTLELDLGSVEPSLAGPKRPQDRVACCRTQASRSTTALPSAGEAEEEGRGAGAGSTAAPTSATRPTAPAAPSVQARLGRHRRHHQLHQHVEPVGDARRRPAREEGGRGGPDDASRG